MVFFQATFFFRRREGKMKPVIDQPMNPGRQIFGSLVMLCLDPIAMVEEAIGDLRRREFSSHSIPVDVRVSSLLRKRSLGWPTSWRSSRGRFRGEDLGSDSYVVDGNLAGSVWPQANLT